MATLELILDSQESSLSVRRFVVEEGMSVPFRITLTARSPRADLDLDSIVGRPAAFRIATGLRFARSGARAWTGVCSHMELVRVEPAGLTTYELTLVPALWLLGQRRNYRLFQHVAIPDIVSRVLHEWGIEPAWRIDRERYPKRELRVQYDETDLAFVGRMLEEAGIAFWFEGHPEKESTLVLGDVPQRGELRDGLPLAFVDDPSLALPAEVEFVSGVRLGHDVRPGAFAVRDFDFRRPRFDLLGRAPAAPPPEDRYEQFVYRPSSSLVEAGRGAMAEATRVSAALAAAVREGATPSADDQGVARHDFDAEAAHAGRALEALRADRRLVRYSTNAIDLAPGVIFVIGNHPRPDLAPTQRLLVTHVRLEGEPGAEWHMDGRAVFAAEPYRPPATTPKPRVFGVQSAIVVGPPGEEIHTDEHGRVRVQLPWDREGRWDEHSSVWLRVSQGWAGPGYGMIALPRVGHEVLVGFLDGDPDAPIVVGRLFNGPNQVPHKLPENRTVSSWKTSSSPGGEGFNEIRLEDARGREHVYVQAERDLDQLVKNDEMNAVGNDRSRVVRNDETIAVGQRRTKVVGQDEIEATGLNHVAAVGVNRVTAVGVDDTTLVGSKWSVTVARGLGSKLGNELAAILAGPLGPVMKGPIASVLGVVPATPLGSVAAGAFLRGALSGLRRLAPDLLRDVLGIQSGHAAEPGPPPTGIEVVDRRITLTTGEASIILDGPNITIMAEGNVMIHARKNAGMFADGEAAVAAQEKLLMLARSDDLVVQSGKNVHLNPYNGEATSEVETVVNAVRPAPEEAVCARCGGHMLEEQGADGAVRLVCERARERLPSGLAPFDLQEALALAPDDGDQGGIA